MTVLERALLGLSACIPISAEDKKIGCSNCPYGCCKADAVRLPIQMIEDIREVLKAQEPRVMTFDEVKKHYNLPPVFPDDLEMQEDYYQDIQPLYFEFPNPCEWDVHWRNSDKVRTYLDEWEDRYNKTWRCWTSRPTDEQREAIPWQA